MREVPRTIVLGPDSTGLWSPGILAVERITNGKRFFVGTNNLLKRFWDQKSWLIKGQHPNPELQDDWNRDPSDFRLLVVQQVHCADLIPAIKQTWVDAARMKPEGCYNVRDSGRGPILLTRQLGPQRHRAKTDLLETAVRPRPRAALRSARKLFSDLNHVWKQSFQ